MGNSSQEGVFVGLVDASRFPSCLLTNNRFDDGQNRLPRRVKRDFDDEGFGEVEKLGYSGVEDLIGRIQSPRPLENGQMVVDAADCEIVGQDSGVLLLGNVSPGLPSYRVSAFSSPSTYSLCLAHGHRRVGNSSTYPYRAKSALHSIQVERN